MGGRLEGKRAIVSGGSRGIGEHIVRAFAAEGASVLALDVLEDLGQALAAELSATAPVHFLRTDVSRPADWTAAVRVAQERLGGIDVLVNNAGKLGTHRPIHEETDEGWRDTMSVVLDSVFYGMRAVLPVMMAQGGGAIVNTSSIWGLVSAADHAAYHAAKGAINLLTKNAAVTYAPHGIRANSVHPGYIATAQSAALDAEGSQWILDRTPMPRTASPAEVAPVYVYLASDEASFTTGGSYLVDGGFTAV